MRQEPDGREGQARSCIDPFSAFASHHSPALTTSESHGRRIDLQVYLYAGSPVELFDVGWLLLFLVTKCTSFMTVLSSCKQQGLDLL